MCVCVCVCGCLCVCKGGYDIEDHDVCDSNDL